MRWSCRQARKWMLGVADGWAWQPVQRWVKWHLARCQKCAALWRQHERLTVLLHQAGGERAQPPADLWQRVAGQLALRSQRRLVRSPLRLVWRWSLAAVGAAALILTVVWLNQMHRALEPLKPSTLSWTPPEPFVAALLHQHLALTANSPLSQLPVTAGVVMVAGERP
ncbi:MAG: hypothetical protein IMHGJWDQ_001575 [Candidatus Fervidibacter sp.]